LAGGSVSLYGGSHQTISPYFEFGGTAGQTQYFVTGRYLQNNLGIENPTPAPEAIHDHTSQERGFAYLSTFLDPYTRLSLIAGSFNASFQIPNVFNAPPAANISTAFGVSNFNSANLNERQDEQSQFGVLALQRSVNGFDGQISYFTRYNNLHFIPDPVGDLFLNGIASDISRQSYTNGFQGDASYAINPAHTLRAGFFVSAEQIWVDNASWVEVRSGDGQILVSQVLDAGTDKVIEGRPPLTVVIGAAHGVALRYEGETVNLAPYTVVDVARLSLY